MPRKAPAVEGAVPLFVLPSIIRQQIKKAGEDLTRIVVKKTGRHFYHVSVHTRPVNREFWRVEPVFAGPSCRRKVRA